MSHQLNLSKAQIKRLADYLADISKGLALGVFITSTSSVFVTIVLMSSKMLLALLFLRFSIQLTQEST